MPCVVGLEAPELRHHCQFVRLEDASQCHLGYVHLGCSLSESGSVQMPSVADFVEGSLRVMKGAELHARADRILLLAREIGPLEGQYCACCR